MMAFHRETRLLGLAGLDERSLRSGENFREENALTPKQHKPAASRVDFDKIHRTALGVVPAVPTRLLPSGKLAHHEWVALKPRRPDRNLGIFKINLCNGKQCDFAMSDGGGYPISLCPGH